LLWIRLLSQDLAENKIKHSFLFFLRRFLAALNRLLAIGKLGVVDYINVQEK
jgi:hypothetical protein